jgi:Domain of unknown function (DUF4167)
MRQGQQNNKRMRGRNRKGPNPLSRSYESNGPDVKVRGTALHIAEKYVQLARDAQSAGDRIQAESYLQHAEHYYRIVSAAQAQMPQPQQVYRNDGDGDGDDEDERGDAQTGGQPQYQNPRGDQPSFGPSDPQPYVNGRGNGQDHDDEQGRAAAFDDAQDGDAQDGEAQPAEASARPQEEGDQAPRESRPRPRRRRPYRDRNAPAGEAAAETPQPESAGADED